MLPSKYMEAFKLSSNKETCDINHTTQSAIIEFICVLLSTTLA